MKIFRLLCFALIMITSTAFGQKWTTPHGSMYRSISTTLVDTPNFSIPFVIDEHGLSSYGLNFGIHPGATTGIDPALGEMEYPPLPPGGGYPLFRTAGGNAILDLRPYTSPAQIDTYAIGIALDESDTAALFPVTFSWPDLHSYYNGSVRLRSDINGSTFDVDMKAQTSFAYAHYTGSVQTLYLYIVAEGPLLISSPPVVSTYGLGNSAFQAIVNTSSGGPGTTRIQFGVTDVTTAWFEYGPTHNYGTSTSPQTIPAGVDSNISSPFSPGSLPPNTRVHFRAVAQNSLGTFYGGDRIVSNGTPPPEVIDTTHYRTATYRDWADAKDQKDKRKSVKCKPDKVDFKLNIGAPTAATGFKLKFNMESSGKTYVGKAKTDTLVPASPWNHTKEVTYATPIAIGDTFQIEGRGFKGKKFEVSVTWATSSKPVVVKYHKDAPDWKLNQPRLPMPNLHNVGEDIYGGVQQTPFQIDIGVKGSPNSVYLPKYKDVLKSLVKGHKGGDIYHTALPHCLNIFDMSKKPISKPQKGLPPDKHNNHLFAEQLTLKLNVLASDSGIFPQGLGNLIYDNSTVKGSTGPFDGMTVRAILDSVDVYLGCRGAVSGTDDSTEFLKVDSLINASFAAPLDTTSWGCVKVVCTGVRTLDDVPYLHPNPNPAPLLMFPPMTAARIYVPTTFSLNQNYPNPFNPTTVISFQLQYPSLVTIKIYNILGQEIATLLDRGEMDDGEQEIEFNASSLPSGVYFYHLKAESIPDEDEGVGPMTFTAVRKMVLVK